MLKAIIIILLLLLNAVPFAHFTPNPPIIDGRTRRALSKAELALSSNVAVFILDSPLDPSHIRSYSAMANPLSQMSHGSLVATALLHHVNAAIIGLPIEDIDGEEGKEPLLYSLRKLLQFARGHPNARVLLNVSLALQKENEQMAALIDELREEGVSIIAAAGNDASETSVYPAAYEPVIAVASAERFGKSPYSNFGNHIDIAASGESSLTEIAFLPYGRRERVLETKGTSYAAPRVTAAMAYVLQKRPEWSTSQAWEFVQDSALPIEDKLFESGKLGAGYLNLGRTKALINRSFFWFHRFLPYLILSLLFSMSVVFVIIKKLPGLFISLLIWLGAVPASFMIILGLIRTLVAIRAGWLAGEGPYMLAALTAALGCMLFLRFRIYDILYALLPTTSIGLLVGLGGVGPVGKGITLTLLPPLAASLFEYRTRKILTDIEKDYHHLSHPYDICKFLARIRQKHNNPRIRDKAHELIEHLHREDSFYYLNQIIEEEQEPEPEKTGAEHLLKSLDLPEDFFDNDAT